MYNICTVLYLYCAYLYCACRFNFGDRQTDAHTHTQPSYLIKIIIVFRSVLDDEKKIETYMEEILEGMEKQNISLTSDSAGLTPFNTFCLFPLRMGSSLQPEVLGGGAGGDSGVNETKHQLHSEQSQVCVESSLIVRCVPSSPGTSVTRRLTEVLWPSLLVSVFLR